MYSIPPTFLCTFHFTFLVVILIFLVQYWYNNFLILQISDFSFLSIGGYRYLTSDCTVLYSKPYAVVHYHAVSFSWGKILTYSQTGKYHNIFMKVKAVKYPLGGIGILHKFYQHQCRMKLISAAVQHYLCLLATCKVLLCLKCRAICKVLLTMKFFHILMCSIRLISFICSNLSVAHQTL